MVKRMVIRPLLTGGGTATAGKRAEAHRRDQGRYLGVVGRGRRRAAAGGAEAAHLY